MSSLRSPAPARHRMRLLAAGVVSTLAAVGVLGLTASPSFAAGVPASGAATGVAGLPADTAAHGYIGFCDEDGHNVVGGSIDTKPFVWKAVGTQAPPKAFRGKGENAVLNVYQPRPETAPAEWSGGSVTAASYYSKPSVPVVQSTYADMSLRQFMQAYPPQVNGLYELRMLFGKANYGLYTSTYPATVIQVVGNRWHVVSGGTVDCSAGKAISSEQATGAVSKKEIVPHAPPASNVLAAAALGTSISGAPTPAGGSGSDGSSDAATGNSSADGAGNTADPAGGQSIVGAVVPASSSDPSVADTGADDATSVPSVVDTPVPPQAESASGSGGSNTWLVVWSVGASVIALAAIGIAVGRRRQPQPTDTSKS